MATVLLATVVKPNGTPWVVRTTAKSIREPAATYPTKKRVKRVKLTSNTILRGKLSTT